MVDVQVDRTAQQSCFAIDVRVPGENTRDMNFDELVN